MKKADYSAIARQGFIADYMREFENIETAVSYDFWCACWLLSNAVGRKLTVPRPSAPVFLNLYTILCAEAGITRKSTAVRHATGILMEYRDNYDGHMGVHTGGITPEKLDDDLARLTIDWHKSHIALSSSELVSLLGRERYSAGLPGKLTDLYDCPTFHTRGTKSAGLIVARDVYLTLLAASTPSWLVRAVNPDVVEGGFTSRCLFVIEEQPKRLIAWPEEKLDADRLTRTMGERLAGVSKEASYVSERAGGIRPTRGALASFRGWYESRVLSSDPFASSFQAREDHHILRLAGLLAVSDNTWEINENHVANAIKVIAHIRRTGVALFGSGIAASHVYALVDRIRHALINAGRSGLSQTALSAVTRKQGSDDERRQILAILHELNLVQKFHVETGERGRPTIMWRATKGMTSPQMLEDVVELLVPTEQD